MPLERIIKMVQFSFLSFATKSSYALVLSEVCLCTEKALSIRNQDLLLDSKYTPPHLYS
jgi:hypothetical protein